jgi:putative addiction module killer protein
VLDKASNIPHYVSMSIVVKKQAEYAEWFKNQTPKFQAQIEKRLSSIEKNEHFGHVKNLGNGLAEVKFNNGVRIYFTKTDKQEIELIAGGNKNGQDKDIAKARKKILAG